MEKIMNFDARQSRILVIDDEENMRHMLSTVLKKSGFDDVEGNMSKEDSGRQISCHTVIVSL